jgi:hypothetical protein
VREQEAVLPGRPFEKGREKTGGRKPGVQNKHTRNVRDALVRALEATAEDGGQEFFADLRDSDPKTFAGLVSKLIPNQTHISGDEGGPVLILKDYTGGASGKD